MRLERKASLLFLISLAVYFVFSFVLSIALAARGLESDPTFLFAGSALLVSLPAFLAPALIFRGINKKEMERFRAPRFTHILIAAVLGYGCIQLSAALSMLNETIFHGIEIHSNSTTADDLLSVNGIVMFFAIAVIPPISEEFMMRGALLESWRRTSPVWAAVLTSALFAFLHLAPSNFIVYFGMGMVFAVVYLITRNVWLTVVMHFVNNMAAVVSALLMQANPDLMSGALDASSVSGDFLTEFMGTRAGSFMMFVFYAASAAALIVPMMLLLRHIYRKNGLGMFAPKPEPEPSDEALRADLPEEKKPSLFRDPILWIVLAILVVLNVVYGLVEFGVAGA